jgi:hypothetical protein
MIMSISLTQPLGKAWRRMVQALFKPFDITAWFVVGFTSFLAGITDSYFPGSGAKIEDEDFEGVQELFEFPEIIWNWLEANPFWTSLIVLGFLLLVALIFVFIWLSSRGAFMFLDNVVHKKSQVAQPWREYSREGNSVFLWRILFSILIFILIIFLAAAIIFSVILWKSQAFTEFPVFLIVVLGIMTLLVILASAYISMFLNNFVIPIMYQRKILVLQAWGIFLKLFREHIGHFLLYGLFLFVLYLGLGIGIVMAGFLTCCIGFLLLIIPYIGSVVLLPFSYTFRAYSLEYLAQFGTEFEIFPKTPDAASEKSMSVNNS